MTGPETDLARIEAALADGRASAADPRERELQELALALRADSPAPQAAFARELDRRVSEGFPKPRRSFGGLPRFWMPALAGAAALILVAVVAIGSLGGGGSDRGTTVSEKQLAAPSSPLPSNAAGVASGSARRVERSVQLTIAAARDKLQEAADGVGTVAESHGGFVLSSNVNTGDQGTPGGTFQLRVPQTQLQATIADLSKLGHLRARSESGQDMTAPYNAVQNRLGNALLERRALALRLRHAHGAKADRLRIRLETLNAAIAGLNGRMNDLRKRTVYSTVSVTLEAASGASGGTGAAWHDATHTLQGMLNFSVRALGVLLPLALLGGLAALAARPLRRRRREAPLL
ncbi:MAG: hypothetical protein QOF55_795 [Thermoleophilaceae bacterium]|jgi:hypothetical protein|nr:hypothetical protein [Thermoleophilaceae bacterium]